MLYLAGIIIALYLFVLLLIKKNKSRADIILTIWMALMGIHQVLNYLDFTLFSLKNPHLLGIGLAFPQLHGVFLYRYVAEITEQKKITIKQLLVHLIPFWGLILLALPFYTLSGAEKIAVFQHQGAGFEWYMVIKMVLMIGSGTAYGILSMMMIQKSRFTNLATQKRNWLYLLSIGLSIIWLLVIFFDDAVIFAAVAILVLGIGILGTNQLSVFGNNLEMPSMSAEKRETNPVRYAKSGLNAEAADVLFDRLTHLLERECVYKNNELSLTELADQLDVPPNYLSQVVNEKAGKNFYTYINTLRVEAFIEMANLPEKQHYSLLALAFESGFNSKSTFNKYFKLVTGETPSSYFGLAKA